MRRALWLVLLSAAIAAGGCASVPPGQEKTFEEARRIADRTTTHYGVRGVRLFVGEVPPNATAAFDTGKNWIMLSADALAGNHWMTILAHELGHVVLRHDLPIVLGGQGRHIDADTYRREYSRIQQQREFDANRKAVEIMTQVIGLPERGAMRRTAEYLVAANRSRGGVAVGLPHGHAHPCDQFQKLVENFPPEWSADLTCKKAEGPYRGPLLVDDADLKLTR